MTICNKCIKQDACAMTERGIVSCEEFEEKEGVLELGIVQKILKVLDTKTAWGSQKLKREILNILAEEVAGK